MNLQRLIFKHERYTTVKSDTKQDSRIFIVAVIILVDTVLFGDCRMTLNRLVFDLQKRKRKQRDLNAGEVDAHIYHGKVTCFISFLNTPCQQNLKGICTDFCCIFITMSSFGTYI